MIDCGFLNSQMLCEKISETIFSSEIINLVCKKLEEIEESSVMDYGTGKGLSDMEFISMVNTEKH